MELYLHCTHYRFITKVLSGGWRKSWPGDTEMLLQPLWHCCRSDVKVLLLSLLLPSHGCKLQRM